jgi:plastocyanin
MEGDPITPQGKGFNASVSRRALLRYGAGLGAAAPVVGAATMVALAQDAPTASPAGSPTAAVTVKMTTQLRFEPADVAIKVGQTITWVNDSAIPHTATCDPEKNPVKETRPEVVQLAPGAEPWDSGLLSQGQTFSHTFTVTGEYKYFCIPHVLSGMLGTITVEE